jgi:hypothetical protein
MIYINNLFNALRSEFIDLTTYLINFPVPLSNLQNDANANF